MRKRCRRKVYALVNPVEHAIEGAAITPEERLAKVRLRELAAIQAFASGMATQQDWHDLCAMLNLAEVMARAGVGPEALDACARLQAELIASAERFRRTGRMGATGPGLQAMRDVYEYHDLQRQSVSRSQYEKAIATATNKLRNKAPEVVQV